MVTVAGHDGRRVVRVEVTDRSGPPSTGAAACRPGCGKRSRASVRCGPRGAVGAAAARWADGDLARAAAPLIFARPLGETESLVRLPGRMRAIILEALSGDG